LEWAGLPHRRPKSQMVACTPSPERECCRSHISSSMRFFSASATHRGSGARRPADEDAMPRMPLSWCSFPIRFHLDFARPVVRQTPKNVCRRRDLHQFVETERTVLARNRSATYSARKRQADEHETQPQVGRANKKYALGRKRSLKRSGA
jgi:hypothetical protein